MMVPLMAAALAVAAGAGTASAPPGPQQPTRPHLIDALARNAEPEIRTEAARMLGLPDYHKPDALSVLKEAMLSDPSPAVRRQAALSALAYEGHEPIVYIQFLLRGEAADAVRRDVIATMATAKPHLQDSEATSALTTVLDEDPSPLVRRAVAKALGVRGDRRALAALKIASEKDPDKATRRAARESHAVLAPPAASAANFDQAEASGGSTRCGQGAGWCQCANGPMKPKARCTSREVCAHTYENSYRPMGYVCSWEGNLL